MRDSLGKQVRQGHLDSADGADRGTTTGSADALSAASRSALQAFQEELAAVFREAGPQWEVGADICENTTLPLSSANSFTCHLGSARTGLLSRTDQRVSVAFAGNIAVHSCVWSEKHGAQHFGQPDAEFKSAGHL